jgi:hypothetical protein
MKNQFLIKSIPCLLVSVRTISMEKSQQILQTCIYTSSIITNIYRFYVINAKMNMALPISFATPSNPALANTVNKYPRDIHQF